MAQQPYIKHFSELERYAPPGHSGTVNVRLVEKDYTGTFEMILGNIEPGCEADPHDHEKETQFCYVLEGEMTITLDHGEPHVCGPGMIVGIPPKIHHHIKSTGDEPLKIIVVYSPPLPPRNDTPVD